MVVGAGRGVKIRDSAFHPSAMQSSILFALRSQFQPFEARIAPGLDPVQRLKARENAAGSENPTR